MVATLTRSFIAERLFATLNEVDLPYCAVGDPSRWPARIEGDLDLVIAHGAWKPFETVLHRFCATHDVYLVQRVVHEHTAVLYILAWMNDVGEPEALHVDVCTDYVRGGRLLIRASALLEGRRFLAFETGEEAGCFVPAPDQAFQYYLLKKIEKGDLSEADGTYLTRLWKQDPEGIRFWLGTIWDDQTVRLMAQAASSGDWTNVRNQFGMLKAVLHRNRPFTLKTRLRDGWRKLGRWRRPPGAWVAVLGPDGSGKTSVLREVKADLGPLLWGLSYVHLRPRLGLRTSDQATSVVDPHARPPRTPVASAAKLMYYAADYIAGYWIKTRDRMARGDLVVFDRYVQDLMVDPRRYRYAGSGAWLKRLARLSPIPDALLILDAPPEVLQARKQEVSFEETARQRLAYRALVDEWPQAVVIDADRPLAEVVAEVERTLLEVMARRNGSD